MRWKRLQWIVWLVILSFSNSFSQNLPHHWGTAIFASDYWNYFENEENPEENWKEVGFDDSGWKTGKGGFGYGDGDDSTLTNKVVTVYSRINFEIPDTSKLQSAMLHFDYDDGIVIYLNGSELLRGNMSVPVPAYNTPASAKREATMYSGGLPESYALSKSKLKNYVREGINTLAVEVHNISKTSSDLSSIVFLSFGITDTSTCFRNIPDWFEPPKETLSNLPLVIINTSGQAIRKGDMIDASMKIVDNGYGQTNVISDEANVYDGKIGIRIRGHASSGFPQKPYRIETRDEAGENNNVSLLGLPKENDWALINNYKDRTFVKHYLGYELSRKMGFYAPRMKHVEVIVNGNSQGIYMLSELIKRDDNRVDIAKLKEEDVLGDQLTGGYIFKVDYYEKDGSDSWETWYQPPHNNNPVHLVYVDPEALELVETQKDYIKDFIERFEKVLYSDNFTDTILGYRAYINVPSFINYLLIQEIALNNDGYKKSCHFHKDKDRDNIRALLNAGPVWDMDWGWRYQDMNSTDPSRAFLTGLEYNRTLEKLWPTPLTWMPRLMEDPQFANEVYTTYYNFRKDVLSEAHIHHIIDSVYNYLGDAHDVHYELYHRDSGTKETYYFNQKEELKEFVNWRLSWLDEHLPGEIIDTSDFIPSPVTYIDSSLITGGSYYSMDFDDELMVKVYPNLVSTHVTIHSELPVNSVTFYTLSGKSMGRIPIYKMQNHVIDVTAYPAGMYLVHIKLKNGRIICQKMMKK